MQKIYPSAEAALDGLLFDGMTIAAGGFGLCGIPERLIDAIQASGVKDLVIASNNAGIDNEGLGKLLRTRQVKKMISSYDGEEYVLERGIRADLSIIKGWKADESGNLVFRKTACNFNLPAATCGKVCVAEVEEIVPVGAIDADCIHLPSIYVNRLIDGAPYDKKIEFRTVRERTAA